MTKTMTIAELKKELAVRERRVAGLVAQRDKLAGQLAAVDRDITALGGEVPKAGRRPGRKAPRGASRRPARKLPKNPKPLIEYVKDVLAKSKLGMRVKEAEAAVRAAGYQTFSKDFYGVVATALRDGPFDRVRRGVYKLKSAKRAPAEKGVKKAAAKKGKKPRAANKAPEKKAAE